MANLEIARLGITAVRLTDLPQEILDQIAECVLTLERKAVLGMARTCKILNKSAIRAIYSSIHCTERGDLKEEKLRRLVETLSTKPHLASFVRSIRLLDWIKTTENFWETGVFGVLPARPIPHVREPIGRFLLGAVPNLRRLELNYPEHCTFLSRTFVELRELVVRPEGKRAGRGRRGEPVSFHKREGALDLGFLPQVLRSPKLRSLEIEASTLMLKKGTGLIVPNSSSIETITIRGSSIMSLETLRMVLAAPRKLFVFDFEPSDYNLRDSFIPKFSDMVRALQPHQSCLKVLRLARSSGTLFPYLDTIDSLRAFTELRNLEVPAFAILGFNHCQHSPGRLPAPGRSPSRVGDALPSSLESIHLVFDDFHCERNGHTYILTAIQSLLSQANDFNSLKHIEITICNGKDDYVTCRLCEYIAPKEIEVLDRRSNISIQEYEKIKASIAARSAPVHFEIHPSRGFWNEDDRIHKSYMEEWGWKCALRIA